VAVTFEGYGWNANAYLRSTLEIELDDSQYLLYLKSHYKRVSSKIKTRPEASTCQEE